MFRTTKEALQLKQYIDNLSSLSYACTQLLSIVAYYPGFSFTKPINDAGIGSSENDPRLKTCNTRLLRRVKSGLASAARSGVIWKKQSPKLLCSATSSSRPALLASTTLELSVWECAPLSFGRL
jgi:hypothetical protein